MDEKKEKKKPVLPEMENMVKCSEDGKLRRDQVEKSERERKIGGCVNYGNDNGSMENK